jgi:methionyl-tRNA formyltransferase
VKLLLFGSRTIGCACLEAVLELPHEVVGVVTPPDESAATGWFSSLETLARTRRLPLFAPERADSSEFIATARSLSPELLLCFDYPGHLGPELLRLAPRGAFNLYATLLPNYRGETPHIRAVQHGERMTGVTLHEITPGPPGAAGFDHLLAQQTVVIGWTDTAYDVYRKQAEAAADLLRRTLPQLLAGGLTRSPLEPSPAPPFGPLRPDECVIDWNRPAVALYNLIRAVSHPYPGAFAAFRGRRCTIWRAGVQPAPLTGVLPAPGTIMKRVPFHVVTGDGLLILRQLQLEGDPELDSGAFVQRYHVAVGESFTRWPTGR